MNERLARTLVDRAIAIARDIGVAVTVAVVDSGGHVVMKLRMDGAALISVRMAEDKAWTAAALAIPTGELTPLIHPGSPLFGLTTAADGRIIALAGGLPLVRDGQLVGGLGVSGGSVDQDEQISEQALATATGSSSATPAS